MPPSNTSNNVDLTSPGPELRSIRSTSATASQSSSLPNAFSQMMGDKGKAPEVVLRDRCKRPTPTYNSNYNPYEPPRADLPRGYTPYVFNEPLFDDRPVIINQLPKKCILAGASKRTRTQWVWPLGYAVEDKSKPGKVVLMWACKLCK
jgi:hypothetical protein